MVKQCHYQNVLYVVVKIEGSGIFSNLGLKRPLSKIPLFGGFLFEYNSIERFGFIKIVLI